MAEKKTKKETAPKKKEAKTETNAAAPAQAKKAVAPAPSAKEARIGVFICHCGTNIAGSIDIKDVEEYAKTLRDVAFATNYQYVCSTPGQKIIADAIKDHNLTGTVVAACSPRLHEPTFRKSLVRCHALDSSHFLRSQLIRDRPQAARLVLYIAAALRSWPHTVTCSRYPENS